MSTRRVVTTHDGQGRSTITSDAPAEDVTISLAPGMVFTPIWGRDDASKLPPDGHVLAASSYFPPPGGATATVVTLPPDSAAPEPPSDISPDELEAMMQQGFAEAEQSLPGLAGVMEPDNPGFHTTDTVDLVYVVSGTVVLETTAGPPTELTAGDVVVQNGTRHAWRNPGSEPATMFTVSLGVDR